MGDGSPKIQGVVLKQEKDISKESGQVQQQCSFALGMVLELGFGRMLGVVRAHCVMLLVLYLLTETRGAKAVEVWGQGVKGLGILSLLGPLMITR